VMAPAQMVEIKDLPPEMRSPDAAARARAARAPGKPEGDMPAANTSTVPEAAPIAEAPTANGDWEQELARTAAQMLAGNQPEVMDQLTRRFEAMVIRVALRHTHGRRIDAAQRLGIGRNTITRKIQELGLEQDEV